jgi:hypothetical protein
MMCLLLQSLLKKVESFEIHDYSTTGLWIWGLLSSCFEEDFSYITVGMYEDSLD